MRLTNEMRSEIRLAILKHKFADKTEILMLWNAEIANLIYDDVFSAKHRRMMNELPKNWMMENPSIRVTIEGGPIYRPYYFAGTLDRNLESENNLRNCVKIIPKAIFKRFPFSTGNVGALKRYTADSKIGKLMIEHNLMLEAVSGEHEEDNQSLKDILASQTTTENLIKIWPELKSIMPKFKQPEKKLPIVQQDVLNKRFNLPVVK